MMNKIKHLANSCIILMKAILKEVLKISIFFLIITIAFSAFQNVIIRLHEEDNERFLGPFRLLLSYFTYMIANFFIPYLNISLKKQMCLGALCHTLNY